MPAAGHLLVSIEANQSSFQFHLSRVLIASRGVNTDNAVFAHGNNTDVGSVCWKVKN